MNSFFYPGLFTGKIFAFRNEENFVPSSSKVTKYRNNMFYYFVVAEFIFPQILLSSLDPTAVICPARSPIPVLVSVSTGCSVFTEIFQEALIGTYIPQYLMTNDSFSSQTWAISVPNRNSDVKSILWASGPPGVRSQNKGYWQFSTILLKLVLSIQITWLPGVFKTLSRTVWETFETQELIGNNFYPKI